MSLSWFSRGYRPLPNRDDIKKLLSTYIQTQKDKDTIDQLELLKLQIIHSYYIIEKSTLDKLIDKTNPEIEPINYFVSRGINNNYQGLDKRKEQNYKDLLAAIDTRFSGSSTDGSSLGGKKRKTKRSKRSRKQTRRRR